VGSHYGLVDINFILKDENGLTVSPSIPVMETVVPDVAVMGNGTGAEVAGSRGLFPEGRVGAVIIRTG
jgi:hypothetical protein